MSNPDYRFLLLAKYGIYKNMDDEKYLKKMYKGIFGRELNLSHPQSYTEKLQWLKLNDRKPEYTVMVDKCDVKEYVKNIIGEQYIIPTLDVWNDARSINFEQLPKQFVLKCTHDSSGLVICKDKNKLDFETSRKNLEKALKKNYYYCFREWPYKDVRPRIIAEKYMEDEETGTLKDYKILCFNGEPKLIELHSERFTSNHTQDFYDVSWNKLSISQYGENTSDKVEEKPRLLSEMLRLSKVLAEGIPHIRVDWYIVDERLYFGELTFYDSSGFSKFDDSKDDELLGSWLDLPKT
jgi:hypothetical protein